MKQIERFRSAEIKIKLDLNEDEVVSCSVCGCSVEGSAGQEVWIFLDPVCGQGDTCCLTCAQLDPNPEPYDTDAA